MAPSLTKPNCRLGKLCAFSSTLAGWDSAVAKAGENGGRGMALSLNGRLAPSRT